MKGIVKFFDRAGNIIETLRITELDFVDEVIVQESIRQFNDDDPCIIHRTYAAKAIALRLLDSINHENQGVEDVTFMKSNLPDNMKNLFRCPDETHHITVV